MIEYPNTFPFPNEIINGWNTKLKGSELKVLLLIVRKTLGWIVDPETGMRKEEDYISYKQLRELTGLSTQPLSDAIDSLVKYKLIQVRNKKGKLLSSKEERRQAGRRKDVFIYRLNLTTLKTKTHCFENQSNTTLKIKDNKINSLQNKLLQKSNIPSKKYSSLKDIKPQDLQEISEKYHLPLHFVQICQEKMTNWLEAKGKRYKNYKRALMNWVLSEAQNQMSKRKGGFVDATEI